jgi:basic membrane lipoprotein Med (substrate-binding protein (PBP1-ABC) superfamily)
VGATAFAASHCSFVVKTDLKRGVGATCASNDECQSSAVCDQGLCATTCAADTDCPAPSICAVGRCRVSLHVAAAFSGIANGQEGWTTSQKLGLDSASDSLGYLRFADKSYLYSEQVRTVAAVGSSIDDYVAKGADVIVVNSASQVPPVLQKAVQYPNVRFITVGGLQPNDTNVGSIFGRNDQSWMVAGQLTAREAKRCIGLIVPLPQTAPVRSINAFVLGAQREKPSMKVILRWMGFWKDISAGPSYDYKASHFSFDSANQPLYREELLAAELADLGCDVVVHKTDTQRTVSFIENRLSKVPDLGFKLFSLAADLRDGCHADGTSATGWQPTCFGTVYWNWGPILTQQLDAIHRGTWTPANIIQPMAADDSSITGFEINPDSSVTGIGTEDARAAIISSANDGPSAVWTGPYATTGQRDADHDGVPDPVQSVAAGETPPESELSSMCWFVQGIYEQLDYTDTDLSHVVPAQVPRGMDPNVPADQTKYGDVLAFVTKLKLGTASLKCGN